MIDYIKITQIMRSAGEIMKRELKNCDIYVKGRADFVTETDLKVQEYIFSNLSALYPQIGAVGEEQQTCIDMDDKMCEVSDKDRVLQWILDPIDGTTNYIYGYNFSAISLALKENDTIIWGAVYNPFTDEMFTAQRGEGAFLNEEPIHVSAKATLSDALIAVGTAPYHKEMADEVFDKIKRLFKVGLDIRRTGSAALDLAYVAAGRQEVYFENNLKIWDFAAGSLILQEAGGVVCDLAGNALQFEHNSDIVACCNGEILKEVLEVLK